MFVGFLYIFMSNVLSCLVIVRSRKFMVVYFLCGGELEVRVYGIHVYVYVCD